MAFKRCGERGCPGKTCKHPWYVKVMVKGDTESGPVTSYLHLLDPNQPTPMTKREADALEWRVKEWVRRGRPAPAPVQPAAPKAAGLTVATAGAAYLKAHVNGLAGKSEVTYTEAIIAAYGHEPIAILADRTTVREFLLEIADATTPQNASKYHTRWSHFLNWSRCEYTLTLGSPFYHRSFNPQGIRKAPSGERRRRLLEGEEAALVSACAACDDGGMMLGRFYCALDAGLRRGEMLQLERGDVLRSNGELALRVRWETSKGKKERPVPVTTDRLAAFLEPRRFERFTFGQHDGTRVDEFRVAWENIQLAAGLRKGAYVDGVWKWTHDADLTWHDLRHECGSRLAEGGPDQPPMPLHEIKDLLGHSDLKTTQKYLNPTQTAIAASMRRIHRARGL